MKIKISDIKTDLTIQVSGKENWLKDIYTGFQTVNGDKVAQIQANLTVTKLVDNKFRVTGSIFFNPFMVCSRCGELAQWVIRDDKINVLFQEEEEIVASEEDKVLLREELNSYYYHNEHIDIELFLNERIQLAIPYRNVPEEVETDHTCAIRPAMDYTFKSDESNQPNPFAALKDHFK